jgi:hypothetical protein
MNIPDTKAMFCDSGHQQIPHVKALGHEYAAVRYRNRIDGVEERPPWRLVGIVDGTMLTYEPAPPAGAPLTLQRGQFVIFDHPGQFVVKSQDDQHPFYMSAHMTGGTAFMSRGDPEFVNVIPPQQYRTTYVFFTDPTYPETDLPIVRVKSPAGFAAVKLDCAGELTGWQPVGTSGQYESTHIDLVRGDFVTQNGCDNGRHEITSDQPFGLTVWGWGNHETSQGSGVFSDYVSYAYPGGASIAPITSVVVPPPPPR